MRTPHPSDARLNRWAAGASGWRASGHIEHCPQCQARLEQLTELEPRLRAQLEANLGPGPTLEQRLVSRLEQELADRETWSLMTDLMNTGLRTSQILIEAGEEGEEDDDERA